MRHETGHLHSFCCLQIMIEILKCDANVFCRFLGSSLSHRLLKCDLIFWWCSPFYFSVWSHWFRLFSLSLVPNVARISLNCPFMIAPSVATWYKMSQIRFDMVFIISSVTYPFFLDRFFIAFNRIFPTSVLSVRHTNLLH